VLVGVSTRPILDATSPIRYFAWFRQMAKSGPSGQTGEAGETGETGEAGEVGEAGETGETGRLRKERKSHTLRKKEYLATPQPAPPATVSLQYGYSWLSTSQPVVTTTLRFRATLRCYARYRVRACYAQGLKASCRHGKGCLCPPAWPWYKYGMCDVSRHSGHVHPL
jgi:hypothetical protein